MAAGKSKVQNDDAWLASLARQACSSAGSDEKNRAAPNSSKRKPSGGASKAPQPTTKEERIQRREQKRLQREDRRRKAEDIRLQRLARKKQNTGSKISEATSLLTSTSKTERHEGSSQIKTARRGMTSSSKVALVQLAGIVDSTVSHVEQSTSVNITKRPKKQKENTTDQVVNGVHVPKGKATKSSTIRPDSKELQPRTRDYNGQGLVRPSLFVPLNDPSFVPKLEMEFAEHIPGFFGRAKTKSAKKQAGANMLWKRRLNEKCAESTEEGGGDKKKKQKKQKMDLEERLEVMIRQGTVM